MATLPGGTMIGSTSGHGGVERGDTMIGSTSGYGWVERGDYV